MRVILFASCLLTATELGHAQATPSLDRLRSEIRSQQAKIVGHSCDTKGPVCFPTERAAITTLLREYTLWKLNSTGGDVAALVADLRTVEDVFALEALGHQPPTWEGRAPYVFRQTYPGGEIILTLDHFATGGLAIPPGMVIIQGYRKVGGQYLFAAETGGSLFGLFGEDSVDVLQPSDPRQCYLLISGSVAGFPGHLGRVRLYHFDGYQFTEEWAPEDHEGLKVTVSGVEIRATYLGTRMHRFGGYYQNCYDETLKVSSAGATPVSHMNNGVCGNPDLQRH